MFNIKLLCLTLLSLFLSIFFNCGYEPTLEEEINPPEWLIGTWENDFQTSKIIFESDDIVTFEFDEDKNQYEDGKSIKVLNEEIDEYGDGYKDISKKFKTSSSDSFYQINITTVHETYESYAYYDYENDNEYTEIQTSTYTYQYLFSVHDTLILTFC